MVSIFPFLPDYTTDKAAPETAPRLMVGAASPLYAPGGPMAVAFEQLDVPGFTVPVHRALTEHILLGGAPRSIAILNGTLAGAVGLGLRLWLVGLGLWAVGHFAAVWAATCASGSITVTTRAPRSTAAMPCRSRSRSEAALQRTGSHTITGTMWLGLCIWGIPRTSSARRTLATVA